MAERVETLPPIQREGAGKRGSKYPLDEWLDGGIWKLTAGEDFDCQPRSLVTVLRVASVERGLKLKTRVIGEKTVYIEAIKE